MKIALLGYGKMGHEVEKAAFAQGHEIVVTIDNRDEWKERGALLPNADVTIDFSQPDQVAENINRCFDIHLPIVVGTTAWQDHLEDITKRCLAEGQSLFHAPNFSIGMNIMFLLNKQLSRFAKQYGYHMSLAETHHIHKLDKPSGTAVKLANDIISVNSDYDHWSIEASNDRTLYINVTRIGEVNGIHSVVADSDADRITLTHEAFNRQGFALGALAAAQFLIGKKGVFTMEDLIEDK